MSPTLRKPAAVRREEIAQAVLRIIGERGLTSLTTSNLAAEVGLTSGALFRHFASQDEILRETTRHAVARIEATFPDEPLSPVDRLLALARNRVRVLGADPGLAWFLRSEQAARRRTALGRSGLLGGCRLTRSRPVQVRHRGEFDLIARAVCRRR